MSNRTPIAADQVAGLIADALVDASLLPGEHVEAAARVAATELGVRLALGNVIVAAAADSHSADAELYRRAEEVLHYIWDPIGVAGVPEARSEYDSYLSHVVRLLKEGGGEDRIAEYLVGAVAGRMGTAADPDRAREAAAVLVAWRQALTARESRP